MKWPTASEAKLSLTILQTMCDRYPMIKKKALAFPFALSGVDLLKIVEDSSLEVVDFIITVFQEV